MENISEYTTLYVEDSELSQDIEFTYRITNIVALGILDLTKQEDIDFSKIEAVIAVRSLNRFPCVLFKIEDVSVIIFKNGKMIITGLKREDQIPKIKKKIEKVLGKAKIKYTGFNITIQNFVAMTNLKRRINLEMACLTLMNCIYEPEQFPAAIIRDLEEGGAFLLFSNSKIICLGIRSVEHLETSLKNLIQQIYDFELVY
ncbi:MAG: hypothetical protein ACTSRE_09550 [Promethearchaeota archaeon]